ncbi:MATE family efflux transporter [Vibrio sp. Vb2110]|uniref:MATE family efflux transporter n=1 Tax=unclassified Vibrio TaxID=2614977 RepID=UPI0029640D1F|nr:MULTISPECIES: MATE family efflux transporter [unclassified Vibrio]MDW1591087.1 MATE family efflux transporter [Vibrio sp. Vb2944]MDW1610283.1 MATE family efflux transporter [Vibrio sp. Vb2908]MDW1724586.1 MATE family efflux transporter [Vibrio sp. Vb2909]MDW1846858.1 MATE family efflux transporter [Vibrio sp. Vb2130]MDW1880977.1 MATE family efflux transporter [Vibrio sp. Vb2110]
MAINLKTDPISKSFYQYLWPALTGMVIKSLFIMGDALFIGLGVGPDGLGAIALVIPPFSIFTAIAMMVGIGGAAKMSIEIGKGNTESSQMWFSQSMLITTLLSTITVTLALIWLDELIALMGASGNLAQLAHDYLIVLLPFFVLYSLAWVLSCFVRNDTNPKLATYAMSIGAITNLAFDYLFIIEMNMGMKGAAYGTAIAQAVIALIMLTHFLRKKGSLEFSLKGIGLSKTKEILSIGTPTFFIEVTSAMTIVLFNYVLLSQFGESHIIAYGLTTNVGVFALFVMVGIAQACQPIISFNHGAGRPERIDEILKLGMKAAMGSGTVFLLGIWLSAPLIASIYLGNANDLIPIAASALTFYFFGVPLMGLNMVIANLFQAIAKPKQATLISLCRGFVFVALGVLLLPKFFPQDGIWASIVFAETLTAVISLSMLFNYRKRAVELTTSLARSS